jgi:hypothetical protein
MLKHEFARIVAGSLLFVLGILLRFGKKVEILAGYNPEKFHDKEGLARWTGSAMLAMAALVTSSRGIELLFPGEKGIVLSTVFVVSVVILGSLIITLGCKRFKKH